MSKKIINTVKDSTLLLYVKDFSLNDVILKNYFYFTNQNFFKNPSIYTDEEIGLILNLTDREYADLAQKIHSNTPDKISNKSLEQSQKKIDALEEKLKKSREMEENEKKITEQTSELESVYKKLDSVKETQEKYDNYLLKYNELSYLTKFDLNKIHNDLVTINQEISSCEQELLNFTNEQIEETKELTKVEYDKGKIFFAFSIFIASILLGSIFFIIKFPDSITWSIWGLGFIITAIFLITSRKKKRYDELISASDQNQMGYEKRITLLKNNRDEILKMIGIQSADEFFNKKAELGAYVKSIRYLSEQIKNLLNDEDYSQLLTKRDNLVIEIEKSKKLLVDPTARLNQDEYLSTRREIDYLKLNLNQLSKNQNLSGDSLISKIKDIRSELKDKLNDFCEVIKKNFNESISKVRENTKKYTDKLNIESIQIDESLGNFDKIGSIHKFLIEYVIFEIIYHRDFVFIYPEFKDDSLTSNKIDELISHIPTDICEFYEIKNSN